jgi:hypothetical protein
VSVCYYTLVNSVFGISADEGLRRAVRPGCRVARSAGGGGAVDRKSEAAAWFGGRKAADPAALWLNAGRL